MRAVMVLLAAVCWALAAWCSRGTLAVTSAAPDAARLGLLPSPARLALLLAAAVIVGLLPAVRRLRIAPLFLSAFALLSAAAWLVSPMQPGGDEPYYSSSRKAC